MGCNEVPLVERLFYGVLAREGLRASEALSLTWEDVDLENGMLHLDENKTDDARSWALDLGVAEARLESVGPNGLERGGTPRCPTVPPRFTIQHVLWAKTDLNCQPTD